MACRKNDIQLSLTERRVQAWVQQLLIMQSSAFCMQNNALINSDIIANADGATCKKKLTEA
jgi:hypothetical protein